MAVADTDGQQRQRCVGKLFVMRTKALIIRRRSRSADWRRAGASSTNVSPKINNASGTGRRAVRDHRVKVIRASLIWRANVARPAIIRAWKLNSLGGQLVF